MKTLYALVHKSNGTIIDIVESAERKENSILITKALPKHEIKVEKDAEGKDIVISTQTSVIEGKSAENISIVKFQWDETTNTIGKATPEVGKTVTLNVEMTSELLWKSANNGLKFVNNKLV